MKLNRRESLLIGVIIGFLLAALICGGAACVYACFRLRSHRQKMKDIEMVRRGVRLFSSTTTTPSSFDDEPGLSSPVDDGFTNRREPRERDIIHSDRSSPDAEATNVSLAAAVRVDEPALGEHRGVELDHRGREVGVDHSILDPGRRGIFELGQSSMVRPWPLDLAAAVPSPAISETSAGSDYFEMTLDRRRRPVWHLGDGVVLYEETTPEEEVPADVDYELMGDGGFDADEDEYDADEDEYDADDEASSGDNSVEEEPEDDADEDEYNADDEVSPGDNLVAEESEDYAADDEATSPDDSVDQVYFAYDDSSPPASPGLG